MHDINRPYTWLALTDQVCWEADYGSLSKVPGIVKQLAVVSTDDPSDPSTHHVVHIPEGATPICFWRVPVHLQMQPDGSMQELERTPITVIGWEKDEQKILLWVHHDGSAILSDQDIDTL